MTRMSPSPSPSPLPLLLPLLLAACPGRAPEIPSAVSGSCGGLPALECRRAEGLLAASRVFSSVRHDLLLDATSSLAPGRGVEREASGLHKLVPTACAEARAPASADVDASTIDFSYVGLAVDQTLVSLDADLAPYLAAGAEGSQVRLRLVAIAFVRDKDPQFFRAADAVTYENDACACGGATHFVGSVKTGGMLSYEVTLRSGEVHGTALQLFRERIAHASAGVTQTQAGGLEVEGIEAQLGASTPRPLAFRVKNPVPIAYALYPVRDVCRFALPAPDVSPSLVDFGDVPYGKAGQRLVHVVNRASVDVYAEHDGNTYAIPAQGSLDVPISWRPKGESAFCEVQAREETLVFTPRDGSAPVVPRQQSVRLVERVRTGKPAVEVRQRVDSGEGRKPNSAASAREVACPADYVLEACTVEGAQCGGGSCEKYQLEASAKAGGCRFACRGPDSVLFGTNFCRFDGVAACRLRCP